MLIDPFTIVAQIVNFVVLALALKYFLYARVIEAMDEREAAIALRLSEAEEREQAAAAELDEYARHNEEFEHERRALLEEVHTEATKNRQQLLDRSRAEVDEQRRRWQDALEAEEREFERELHRRTSNEVVELSRQALLDLSSTELEAVIVRRGLKEFGASGQVHDELLGAASAQSPVTVRTAFVLSPELQNEVTAALGATTTAPEPVIHFEVDSALILGIEFRCDVVSVAWNAADYLGRLDARVAELASLFDRSDDGG